jgi:hypothetical protein
MGRSRTVNVLPTYVRFVSLRTHPDSGSREGVFSVAYAIREDAATSRYDQNQLTELIDWFKSNLPVPDRFSRYDPKKDEDKPRRGIAWFKDSATEHITMMRELIALVEGYGHPVEQIMTRRPGVVVYEDRFQIVAEPFADTKRKRAVRVG